MGDLHQQASANLQLAENLTNLVLKIDAKSAGISAIAQVVDENESNAVAGRIVSAQKELISFLYRESHSYVTLIVAGAYAAFFTVFSITSARLPDQELFVSSLLMTISVSIFVIWEIFSMSLLGWLIITDQLGKLTEVPRWYRFAWPITLLLSVATALPAAGISAASYLEALRPPPSRVLPKPLPSLESSKVAPDAYSSIGPE